MMFKEHRYSFSQVDAYLNCPRKYEFRYIIKPPAIVVGSPELIIGDNVHKAIADILTHKMNGSTSEKNTRESINKYNSIMRTQLKELSKMVEVRIDTNEMSRQYVALIEHWKTEVLPEFVPTAVESQVVTNIAGHLFIMYIDAIHNDSVVYDWKVTTRKKSQRDADMSLQLSIYAMGTGIRNVAFCSLIRPKEGHEARWKPVVDVEKSPRNDNDLGWAERTIKDVITGITKKYFPVCGPDNFLCNPKYCDFWPLCKGSNTVAEPSWLKDIVGQW